MGSIQETEMGAMTNRTNQTNRTNRTRLNLAEERALVDRMLAGDEAAFERFAEEYYPGLYRFVAGRLRQPELARDIVQTAACKAMAKLGSYRGEAPLFTWLCAIGRTEIALHYRGKSRSPRTVELAEATMPPGPASPEAPVLRRETRALVHQALDGLPSSYGRALEWKYMEGVPVKEIARRLEVSPKAAESLLTRARNAFRDGYQQLTKVVELRPLRRMETDEEMGCAG